MSDHDPALSAETLAKWREGAVIEATMCTYHPRGIYGKRILALLDSLAAEKARTDTLEAQAGSLQRLCEELEARAEQAEKQAGINYRLADDRSAWKAGYDRLEAALSRVLADVAQGGTEGFEGGA